MGENPVVGSVDGPLQRKGLREARLAGGARLRADRDRGVLAEAPEIERGEVQPEDIATEVFFFPAAAHTEKDGTFTNTQRLLQWHHKAVEPPGDCRSELWFVVPPRPAAARSSTRARRDERDRPIRALTWDYPDDGRMTSRAPRRCCARSTATTVADRQAGRRLHRAEGRRLDRVRLLDLLRLLRRTA